MSRRDRFKPKKCKHRGPSGASWAQAWHPRIGFVYGKMESMATESRCMICGEVVSVKVPERKER